MSTSFTAAKYELTSDGSVVPILHGDLIGCASDLVLCREASPEMSDDDEHLVAVRAAAARYLVAAFAYGANSEG